MRESMVSVGIRGAILGLLLVISWRLRELTEAVLALLERLP